MINIENFNLENHKEPSSPKQTIKIKYAGKSFKVKAAITLLAIILVSLLTTAIQGNLRGNAPASLSSVPRVIYSLDKRENDKEIIKLIDEAGEYVHFAVYYFSHKDIAGALIRAKERGVEVEGIIDREGEKSSANASIAKLLRGAGITVLNQKHEDGIMHVKTIVTEKAYASGSYNWTNAATEANDEVLEIGYDENIRKQYQDIVDRLLAKNWDAGKEGREPVRIGYEEAKDHIGDYAFVSGNLVKIYTSGTGTKFLQFCKTSKCPFSVVIFASDTAKFKDVMNYSGPITVKGIIRSYKNNAEIIAESPEQIVKDEK